MNIDKAVRKQKKSYRIFMLSMSFIFFALPTFLYFSKRYTIFYMIYLMIIEILIFLAVIIRTSNELLSFEYNKYKLVIMLGLKRNKINIICDKIILVDVESYTSQSNALEDFKIIILATSKFRSSKMLPVRLEFLKRYSYIAYEYDKFKMIHPEWNIYYTVIKRGGIKKYLLLNYIYKSCVYAHFTEQAIDKIKYYRDNSDKIKNK
ncbi:hypothetical protein GTH52_11310 [Clostridium tyrobutyricum]|uniref:Hypothetical membrane protein n=1 Tax=Clostridium tyrobutyricum DIVETGP TaxID=1408889 RepID=W6NG93_CLOTY|nr:hypothetical protein [Clostridium tyrobutyricum]AND83406.1 hypothetical protein CTK_C01360 [Clostridium tyrobutyricum]ANP68205.1 hypothetical protein BA182_00490 [Clostridium tyrobutyricum]MBR9648870.1 hypothetical protein [Clostridium tyrobutyricum]MBV4416254.1 hypothetical protein [Clostridium tyrobutyricum]MBV4421502.1 hypothetical protein [Clostridium tyrobutyricum]